MTTAPAPPAEVITLELRGGNAEFWEARESEILVEGPRGTGKTYTILQLINQLCHAFPGLQWLIVRKYAVTLGSTCLKTLNEQILKPGDGTGFFSGSQDEPASYRYRNGSRIVVGGLDNPKSRDKLLSAEYDGAYVNELTELSEDDLIAIKATLRHTIDGKPVIEHQRVMADCNPANRSHWVNQRCERGQMRRIRTRLTDNPLMAHADGRLTEYGERYVRENLPPIGTAKYDSWVQGLWTGTENACYALFDRAYHIRPLEPLLAWRTVIIWVDYGAVHRCSVGMLGIDQYNRRWMLGCEGKPDTDQGATLTLTVSQYKERAKRICNVVRGRVDPNQAYLAGRVGFSVAKGGNGGATGAPRLHRIDLMEPLFATYPGGRVPSFTQEKGLIVPQGPFAEAPTPGIILVEGATGTDELADQIEGYHYVYTETPRGITKDVYRVDEDHVAGMEYANEEWMEGEAPSIGRTVQDQTYTARRAASSKPWVSL